MPRQHILLLAAVAVLAIAFFLTPYARRPGLPYDLLLFGILAPVGWVLAWSGVSSWRLGIATYVVVGIATLAVHAAPEGLEYFPDHWNDADSVFWRIYVPIMCWPGAFEMLLAFGVVI